MYIFFAKVNCLIYLSFSEFFFWNFVINLKVLHSINIRSTNLLQMIVLVSSSTKHCFNFNYPLVNKAFHLLHFVAQFHLNVVEAIYSLFCKRDIFFCRYIKFWLNERTLNGVKFLVIGLQRQQPQMLFVFGLWMCHPNTVFV